MKVKDLIEQLQTFSLDAYVIATWEGQLEEISVYISKDGIVLIDADNDFYKEKFVSGERSIQNDDGSLWARTKRE